MPTDDSLSVGDAVRGMTITSAFRATVDARPDAVALNWRERDGYATLTWEQYAGRAVALAAGLSRLGVGRGDRVALMMRNRPEFHVADTGALLLGATPFSIYNSSAPEQIQYLLSHSEAKVAVVEDAEFLARLMQVRDQLPELEHVVVVEPGVDGALAFAELLDGPALDLDAVAVAEPGDLATLVYTSGTTGPPKGAMITHAGMCWILESFQRRLSFELAGRRLISYLPMAHVLERDVTHYLHVIAGSNVTTCPDPTQVASYLRDVRPEFFAAVPRVWEKLCAAIQGRGLSPEQARAELGLDACIAAFSGGAPIPAAVHSFFLDLGVPLGEGYGLTESSFVVTYDVEHARVGTVGRPLPEVELTIGADGEVLGSGPFVFHGYLKDPERTAEAVEPDGTLHTGDIGVIDDGYLQIVDRKKELIITAGGKNISPANIESALKSHPMIGQACVIGDRRPYLVALVVLDPEGAPRWAAEHGLQSGSLSDLSENEAVVAEVARCVAEVNERVSRTEQVKRFCVLHEEWLADSEELTPTMKLKRRTVLAKYEREIDELYGEAAPALALTTSRTTTDEE